MFAPPAGTSAVVADSLRSERSQAPIPPPPKDQGKSTWVSVAADLGLDVKARIEADKSLLSAVASKVVHSATGRMEDVKSFLPLPVPPRSLEEDQWAKLRAEGGGGKFRGAGALRRAAGVAAWLWLMIVGLNTLFSGFADIRPSQTRCSPGQFRAMDLLRLDATHFVDEGGEAGDLTKDWAL